MQQVLQVASGDATKIFAAKLLGSARTIDVAYAVYKFFLNRSLVQ